MSSFITATRNQYTYFATDTQTVCLTTLNVKTLNNPNLVNIVAICSIKIKDDLNIVKIIVGTDNPNEISSGGGGDPLNPNPLRTNELQNIQFQKNLQQLNIDYTIEEVIQIFNIENVPGTPGIFRMILAALDCASIRANAFYQGEWAIEIPIVNCGCDDSTMQFKSYVISAFVEVPAIQLDKALNVIGSIDRTEPFNESQLCINADNVEVKCISCQEQNNCRCRCSCRRSCRC